MGLRADDPIYFFFGHVAGDAHAWLERMTEQVAAGLVVIDTWHKLTLIESVNDYGAVNRANQRLQQLARERGVSQVWLHHSNKGIARNGSEVLGSQALFAAVDTLMSMDRAEDGTRTIWTIQRTGEDMEPTVVTMGDDQLITAAGGKRDLEIQRARKRILDSLGDEPMGSEELREASGLRRALFWAALNALVRTAEVTRIGEGRRTDPYRYSRGDHNHSVGDYNANSEEYLVPSSPIYYRDERDEKVSRPHLSGTTSGLPGTTGDERDERDERDEKPADASGDLLAYAAEVFGDA